MTEDRYRDRYEPVALAGRGAQGEVWLAHDHLHDRQVALKIRRVGDGGREELLTEARTLLGLRPHPSLPLVRDDLFVGDRYVIVMDWIEGRSLAGVRPETFEEVVEHLDAVARALDHLHAHEPPIIHRDVKPQNILVTPDGRTMLVDFGIAGETTAYYRDATPAFAAPEIAFGQPATPASDVFSLAVTAYVLLTGEFPEAGREPAWSIVPEPWKSRVREALAGAFSIDPSMRPSSASELVSAIRPPTSPNNLPAPLSSFVGRGSATAELRRLATSVRALTLTGPGGSGKTRLALHVADAVLPAFTGGVWLAELAGVTDPTLVPSRVAVALGVRTDGGRSELDALTASLLEGRQLLILDNCEHVVDSCAHLVDALLRACPELTILATSREPLRVTGEAVWNAPPLDGGDAASLFADRAPFGFSVTDADEDAVAEICRRLDGIPLAIELAAAQLSSMDASDLARALDTALGVLTGGVRTNPRQETMRATIDWSYNLLSADDRSALRGLSVFAGGFTAEAAVEVCDAEASLKTLVDTSLLAHDGGRFRILETVRQYAAGLLDGTVEKPAIVERHARWVAEFARGGDPDASPSAKLDRVAAEHDNIEAALAYAVPNDPETGATIARSVIGYWMRRDWNSGRRWMNRLIDAGTALDPRMRSDLLVRASELDRLQGALTEAREKADEAIALDREQDDKRSLATSLGTLAAVAHGLGDLDLVRSCVTESIALHRETENRTGLGLALNNLAVLHIDLGETDEAKPLVEEALAIFREHDPRGLDSDLVAHALINLGGIHRKLGDDATARRYNEEALERFTSVNNAFGRIETLVALADMEWRAGDVETARDRANTSIELARQLGYSIGIAEALQLLGDIDRAEAHIDQAVAHHSEGLALMREAGSPLDVAFSLTRIAFVEFANGDHVTAVQHFGEAEALYESVGAQPFERAETDAEFAALKDVLGPEGFAQQWEAGRRNALAGPISE